jgi:LemA protein
MGMIGLILLGILVLAALWLVGLFNRLVGLRNQVKNAWSQIDVQLQRRYDLIPNLVETVKGYMGYEKGTLENVIKARNQASAAREAIDQSGGPTSGASMKDLLAAEATLRQSIPQIFALAEAYPELKASENMRVLQEELGTTENRIAFARQAYNDQAMTYNTAQQVFPAVLVAALFGHHPVDLYEVSDQEAKKSVKVSF